MKTTLIVITVLFFLTCGCARTHYLSHIVDEWGPPGKIEETDNTTTYFYYFYKGKLQGGAVGGSGIMVVGGEYSAGWKVFEFIADKTGKVIKTREYLKQPEVPPK